MQWRFEERPSREEARRLARAALGEGDERVFMYLIVRLDEGGPTWEVNVGGMLTEFTPEERERFRRQLVAMVQDLQRATEGAALRAVGAGARH